MERSQAMVTGGLTRLEARAARGGTCLLVVLLVYLATGCTVRAPVEVDAQAPPGEVLKVEGFRASLPMTEAPDWYVLPERRGGDMAEQQAVRDLGERHRVRASVVARPALTPATVQTDFDERVLDAPADGIQALYEDELAGTLRAIEQSAREPGSGMRVVASRGGARPPQAAAGAACVELTQRMEAPGTVADEPAVRFRETTYTCFHPERRGSMVALVYAEEWHGTIGEASGTFNAEAAAFLDSLTFD
jgi:hypothetical protein